MIKKVLFLIFYILTNSYHLNAQSTTLNNQDKKIYLESSARLSFGKKTRLGLAPSVNYRIGENMSLGIAIIGEYYSNYDSNNIKYNTFIYGSSLIVNYKFNNLSNKLGDATSVYLNLEQEFLNLENQYFSSSEVNGRSFYDGTFLGIKIKREMKTTKKHYLSLVVSWNLNNSNAMEVIYKPQFDERY